MLLVDTSLWIEVFRKPSRLDLRTVVDLDEVVTCLPVIQEVLQGFREESAFRIAREAMLAFPIVEAPLSIEVFEDAVFLYRSARRRGITVRSRLQQLRPPAGQLALTEGIFSAIDSNPQGRRATS